MHISPPRTITHPVMYGRVARTSFILALAFVLLCIGTSMVTASALADQAPTLVLSDANVLHDTNVTANGVIDAVAGVTISIDQLRGESWVQIATGITDAGGAYSATFGARRKGYLRARRTDTSDASASTWLKVRPRFLSFTSGTPVPWLGQNVSHHLAPSTYNGTARISVWRGGVRRASKTTSVVNGWLRTRIPMPGVGVHRVYIKYDASRYLTTRTHTYLVYPRGRALDRGDSGVYVRGLINRLKELKFHHSGAGDSYGWETSDAVMAFHKIFGPSRTYSITRDDFSRLMYASPVRTRYALPTVHIEVNKSKQYAMIVKNGRAWRVIAVSTGATGNTPVGAFRILRKNPTTTTWLGPGILYRTMTFYGGFAMHGYNPVPPYPASHGCVREPMWAADFFYDNSYVGERIYIYN